MDEREQLTHEEAITLIKLAQAGDEGAQERLVAANTALVRSVVKRFQNRAAEYEDLYQIGCLGLVKAIRNFDLSYDVRFSTYAVPMIAGEIKRFLRDDGMIKVSRSLKELASRAAAAREELSLRLGREAGVVEIAAELGVDAEEVAQAMEAARPHVSIYEPAYGADSDALLLDTVDAGEDELGTAVDRVTLKELLGALPPRDRTIIMLRYFSDQTQSQVAARLGISQVQVSRLESRILSALREKLTD